VLGAGGRLAHMSAPAAQLRHTTDLIGAFNEADWDRLEQHLARDVRYSETGTGRRTSTLHRIK
jgi:hypothetical protein